MYTYIVSFISFYLPLWYLYSKEKSMNWYPVYLWFDHFRDPHLEFMAFNVQIVTSSLNASSRSRRSSPIYTKKMVWSQESISVRRYLYHLDFNGVYFLRADYVKIKQLFPFSIIELFILKKLYIFFFSSEKTWQIKITKKLRFVYWCPQCKRSLWNYTTNILIPTQPVHGVRTAGRKTKKPHPLRRNIQISSFTFLMHSRRYIQIVYLSRGGISMAAAVSFGPIRTFRTGYSGDILPGVASRPHYGLYLWLAMARLDAAAWRRRLSCLLIGSSVCTSKYRWKRLICVGSGCVSLLLIYYKFMPQEIKAIQSKYCINFDLTYSSLFLFVI